MYIMPYSNVFWISLLFFILSNCRFGFHVSSVTHDNKVVVNNITPYHLSHYFCAHKYIHVHNDSTRYWKIERNKIWARLHLHDLPFLAGGALINYCVCGRVSSPAKTPCVQCSSEGQKCVCTCPIFLVLSWPRTQTDSPWSDSHLDKSPGFPFFLQGNNNNSWIKTI